MASSAISSLQFRRPTTKSRAIHLYVPLVAVHAQADRSVSAPFPMELGERHPLPSLLIATKADFDATLSELKELSGVQYIPAPVTPPPAAPTTAEIVIVDDPPKPISPAVDAQVETRDNSPPISPVIYTPPTPNLHESIVHVNLKNNITGDGHDFALVLEVPYNPFASQIIAPLWSNHRVAAIVGKWHPARIRVAFSRKLISVNQSGYDGVLTGFQELGTFADVFGNFSENGFGGLRDKLVPEALLPADELDTFRELYSVNSAAKVFSVFFFYLVCDKTLVQ